VRTPSFSDWLTVLLTAYKIARQFEFNSVRHRVADISDSPERWAKVPLVGIAY
jgi:hypothetical protein